MTAKKLVQPIKYHGGKHYLASRIVALMPPRCKNPNGPSPDDPGWLAYCEPYCGGCSVLLAQDPEGVSEAVNDINPLVSNFWAVLQNKPLFDVFCRFVSLTPFSKLEFDAASEIMAGTKAPGMPYTLATGLRDARQADAVAKAIAFFVRSRMSLGARLKSFSPSSRNRTRQGMNEQVAAYLSAVDGLPEVAARMRRVLVLCGHAPDIIRGLDGPRALFYCDPPYLPETRAAADVYEDEMTYTRHAELLETLADIRGKFLLSGYRSDLYDVAARSNGWNRHDIDISNHAAGGKSKRRMVECVWTNY